MGTFWQISTLLHIVVLLLHVDSYWWGLEWGYVPRHRVPRGCSFRPHLLPVFHLPYHVRQLHIAQRFLGYRRRLLGSSPRNDSLWRKRKRRRRGSWGRSQSCLRARAARSNHSVSPFFFNLSKKPSSIEIRTFFFILSFFTPRVCAAALLCCVCHVCAWDSLFLYFLQPSLSALLNLGHSLIIMEHSGKYRTIIPLCLIRLYSSTSSINRWLESTMGGCMRSCSFPLVNVFSCNERTYFLITHSLSILCF